MFPKLSNIKHFKYHLLIGLVLGLWIYLFLVLIGPFDVVTVSLKNRLKMMPGYGVIFTAFYILFVFIQQYIEKLLPVGSFRLEFILVVFIGCTTFFPVYFYYKSSYILGEYSLSVFLFQLYLPILSLVLPFLLLLRWFVVKSTKNQENFKILGKGKYDQIKLKLSDLIYVKGADNYVEVHYLENQSLKQKLIRCTIKEIKKEVPELIQTHRSYLMNPTHFISWKNRNNISLTMVQIPVSETYRNLIPALSQAHHK